MRYFIFMVGCFLCFSASSQDTTRLSILFAGDIMGHDSQIASAYNPTTKRYDYTSCFQFMKPYIQSTDLSIGNLELTLAGPPYKGYPQFGSPDELAVTLKDVGFDVLVTANNHSVDRGKHGIERTIKMLDSLDIPHTGTFVDEMDRLNNYPLMLHKNGFTIALLNYTYGTNGISVPKPTIVNPIDTAMIRKDLMRAKEQNPDIIIVFTHWGSEYEHLPRKSEKNTANFCLRHGAQLVIGSHPHVLQPMEWKKEKNEMVVYSLGNYVSGQRKRYTDGGAMAFVGLEKVRYNPDSIITTIDSTGYYLHWVYRTADTDKDYYILPVPSFENDSKFIKDAASRLALKTFITDSRALYGTHNKSVKEIKTKPADSVISYKVVMNISLDSANEEKSIIVAREADVFYGYEILDETEEQLTVTLGDFNKRQQADLYCERLKQKGKAAEVAKFVNNKRVEVSNP